MEEDIRMEGFDMDDADLRMDDSEELDDMSLDNLDDLDQDFSGALEDLDESDEGVEEDSESDDDSELQDLDNVQDVETADDEDYGETIESYEGEPGYADSDGTVIDGSELLDEPDDGSGHIINQANRGNSFIGDTNTAVVVTSGAEDSETFKIIYAPISNIAVTHRIRQNPNVFREKQE